MLNSTDLVPPGVVYSTKSGWNALLPKWSPAPLLAGEHEFDYAVVGAGFAGLATARQLATREPDARIAVIEASVVGEGASGRNSGFMSPARLTSSNSAVAEMNRRGMDEVLRLVENLGINCQLKRTGGYRCSATEKGQAELRKNIQFLRDTGAEHSILDRRALESRIGTPFYNFGVFIDDTYLIQPAALVRGLAATVPPNVRLFENSLVTHNRRGQRWRLETARGAVTADIVILAANTAIRRLGYLKGYLMAVYTYAGLTPVLSEVDMRKLGSDSEWGVSPTFKYGTTMRLLPERRILVRSNYSYESEYDSIRAEAGLRTSLHKHFPQLSHLGFEHVWGGVLGMTWGRAPIVKEVQDRLYAIGGCNGSGIAKFSLLGKELADQIVSDKNRKRLFAAFGTPRWMAPGPIRKLGYLMIEAAGRRMAGKDV